MWLINHVPPPKTPSFSPWKVIQIPSKAPGEVLPSLGASTNSAALQIWGCWYTSVGSLALTHYSPVFPAASQGNYGIRLGDLLKAGAISYSSAVHVCLLRCLVHICADHIMNLGYTQACNRGFQGQQWRKDILLGEVHHSPLFQTWIALSSFGFHRVWV